MKYEIIAPAKINLYLDVLSKRENGYHDIESVMQSITLCDTVSLEIEETGGENEISVTSDLESLPNDKSNLVYKAANDFFDYTKITGKRVSFHIAKRIPVCAGMAGGSTDAAASLKLLNMACMAGLSEAELCKIGGKIGADIPFCIVGGTCICRGIGEKIIPLEPLEDVYLVCAIGNESVSTPVAFGKLDEKFGTLPVPYGRLEEMSEAVISGDLRAVCSCLFNKFESVICDENSNVDKIKKILAESGAIGTLMSGSGPSVFGIFLDEKSQRNAHTILQSCSIRSFLCKTL